MKQSCIITKERAIEKTIARYGNRRTLDLSDSEYDSESMVLCRCNEHKTSKYVNLRHFLGGESCGCDTCVSILKRNKDKEKFIAKMTKMYGDSYSFDKLNYVDWKSPGIITCKKHGDFELPQIRYAFDNIPCPTCYEENKKANRNEEYLKRLNEKYGDKYKWITADFGYYNRDYVEFICPKHGLVKQKLVVLLKNTEDEDGYACPKCRKERQNIRQSYTLTEAINKAKTIENCKYYDFRYVTEWLGVKHKYKFACSKHGCEFEQSFDSLLNNQANACPQCYAEHMMGIGSLTKYEFIEKATKVHGKKFDYSKVDYVNYNTPVCIICPKHGEFLQAPGDHLSGSGCPKCRNSRLEEKIRVALENNSVVYTQEKSVRKLTGESLKQRVDFYISDVKACIECQGIQHFAPTKFNVKMTNEETVELHKKVIANDLVKYESLTNAGYDVIYFTEKKFEKYCKEGWYSDKKVFYDIDSILEYIEEKQNKQKQELSICSAEY